MKDNEEIKPLFTYLINLKETSIFRENSNKLCET